jgi:type I restriction enzyme S subunit
MLLKVPRPDEQRAIAQVLGTLDDKIEINRRTNETLEAIARAIFKSWFVDFDPVRKRADDRDPYLPKAIADLFPDRFEKTVIEDIPAQWEVGTLGDIAALVKEPINPLDNPSGEFLHLSIPAFDEGQQPKQEAGAAIKSLKFRVPDNVVLLAKLNPEIERVWLVDVGTLDRAVCSTEFLVLRPKPPFSRFYLYCLARSPGFRSEIEGLVTGTSKSHQRAQADAVLDLVAPLPQPKIVKAFESVVAPLLERTLANKREMRTLAALRDTLLPKLVSGELRVKDP